MLLPVVAPGAAKPRPPGTGPFSASDRRRRPAPWHWPLFRIGQAAAPGPMLWTIGRSNRPGARPQSPPNSSPSVHPQLVEREATGLEIRHSQEQQDIDEQDFSRAARCPPSDPYALEFHASSSRIVDSYPARPKTMSPAATKAITGTRNGATVIETTAIVQKIWNFSTPLPFPSSTQVPWCRCTHSATVVQIRFDISQSWSKLSRWPQKSQQQGRPVRSRSESSLYMPQVATKTLFRRKNGFL